MATVFIYVLVSARDGLPAYVGQSVDVQGRFEKHHLRDATNGSKKQVSCWIRAERDAGFDVHPRIIEECSDQSIATVREAHYIELLRAKGYKLTNSTQGNGQGARAAWLAKVLLAQREQMERDREWFLKKIVDEESAVIRL